MEHGRPSLAATPVSLRNSIQLYYAMRNKWKVAFWVCLFVLVSITLLAAYAILDQAVTLTYLNVSYSDTVKDLDYLSLIISETDLSKQQVTNVLREGGYVINEGDISNDTIILNDKILVFSNHKISQVLSK